MLCTSPPPQCRAAIVLSYKADICRLVYRHYTGHFKSVVTKPQARLHNTRALPIGVETHYKSN